MWVRLFQIFTVLFWLASVGWLMAVVWAPMEKRMKPVEAREALNAFFQWNESTNMTLLENGARRGQVTMAGYSGFNEKEGRELNGISLSGLLESEAKIGVSGKVDLFWRGVLEFLDTEEMPVHQGDFSVRIPNRQLSAHLAFAGEPKQIKVQAMLNKIPIFSYDSSAGTKLPDLPQAASTLLPLAGLPDPSSVKEEQIKPKVAALRGMYRLSGRELPVYLLKLEFDEFGQTIQIFLSEAGEPLRIETGFGYEAISEMLVPLEVYKQERSGRVPEKEN